MPEITNFVNFRVEPDAILLSQMAYHLSSIAPSNTYNHGEEGNKFTHRDTKYSDMFIYISSA